MERTQPLNEVEAQAALSQIEDSVTRNLIGFAVARARMEFMHHMDESTDDVERRLPSAAFDMRFFVQVLVKVFSKQQVIRDLLAGKTVAEATGWGDV
jgi:hypothetical protein